MNRIRRTAAILIALLSLGALAACAPETPNTSAPSLQIAGGGKTGVYYSYGAALAAALTHNLDEAVDVAETEGSVDNLLRVARGEALLGFAQSDAAVDALVGAGRFDRPLPIRATARLYDEYVHVVVRADSDIQRVEDLSGRRFSLGAANSGVTVVATRVLAAVGIGIGEVRNPQLGVDASIAALERGEIEGFFWVGGVPTPGIEQLAAQTPVRLLPIEADVVDKVNTVHSGVYRQADFPGGAYGHEQPTTAMTVPNFLVTSADAPEELIHDAMQTLFAARRAMSLTVPSAALLDVRQAIFTDPVELHPGAARFYRELRD